jgi:hypothetical protein
MFDKKAYRREYHKRPYVIAKEKLTYSSPEYKAKKKIYSKKRWLVMRTDEDYLEYMKYSHTLKGGVSKEKRKC